MLRLTHSFTIEPPPSFAHAERFYRERNFDEAFNLCSAILNRAPTHFDALHLSGVICLDRGDHGQASEWLAKAEQVNPSAPRLQYHLGNAAMAAGRTDDAIAYFHKTLALEPELPDALNNLGTCLRTLGRDQEAIACFEQVLTRDPAFMPALYNLAITLARIGRAEEAIVHFTTVIGASQHAAGIDRLLEARDALAGALMSLGKYDEALAIAKTRTALKPEDPRGEWHESILLLTLGNFREGLPLYERRWELPGFRTGKDAAKPPPRVPDLSELAGRRVHLYAEQGRGDTVQFVRYAPLVRRSASFVSVSVPADLIGLIRTVEGIDSIVTDSEPAPESDLSIPIMSLPLLFKTEMETTPSTVPYLAAPQNLLVSWQERTRALQESQDRPVLVGLPAHPRAVRPHPPARSLASRRWHPISCVAEGNTGYRPHLAKGIKSPPVQQTPSPCGRLALGPAGGRTRGGKGGGVKT